MQIRDAEKQGAGNLSRMPRSVPMVGTGLYDTGRGALYRQIFQTQTILVCCHGLWEVGHDFLHGERAYPDSIDHRTGLPGGGYFFTQPAFYGAGGERAGCAWRLYGERTGKASFAARTGTDRSQLSPHGLPAGVEPGGGKL